MLDTIEKYLAASNKGPYFDYFTQCVRHRLHQVAEQMKKLLSETERKSRIKDEKSFGKDIIRVIFPITSKAKVKVSRKDVDYVHLV